MNRHAMSFGKIDSASGLKMTEQNAYPFPILFSDATQRTEKRSYSNHEKNTYFFTGLMWLVSVKSCRGNLFIKMDPTT